MSVDQTFGDFFKAEVKSSGAKLFAQEKISISSGSDTDIHAYARVSPPAKVRFTATDIESETFTATCNCPVASKGRFCKHIWGVLLAVEESYPDFLSSKKAIDSTEPSETPTKAQEAKARASDYRKEQYQKQKKRAKETKRGRSSGPAVEESNFPPEFAEACAYFEKNGFPMPDGLSDEVLKEAKRKLSRVFHPDKGGSHDEIIELNRYCDLLLNYRSRG